MMDRTQYQIYEPWKPGAFPKVSYSDMLSLKDSSEGLEIDIIFFKVNRIVTVAFDYAVVYRVIDEGNRILQFSHVSQTMTETMYVVSNSDMVEELVEESRVFKPTDVIHYLIMTANKCIDVIAKTADEPKLKYKDYVERVNKK